MPAPSLVNTSGTITAEKNAIDPSRTAVATSAAAAMTPSIIPSVPPDLVRPDLGFGFRGSFAARERAEPVLPRRSRRATSLVERPSASHVAGGSGTTAIRAGQ